jgi:hypothetical protein
MSEPSWSTALRTMEREAEAPSALAYQWAREVVVESQVGSNLFVWSLRGQRPRRALRGRKETAHYVAIVLSLPGPCQADLPNQLQSVFLLIQWHIHPRPRSLRCPYLTVLRARRRVGLIGFRQCVPRLTIQTKRINMEVVRSLFIRRPHSRVWMENTITVEVAIRLVPTYVSPI